MSSLPKFVVCFGLSPVGSRQPLMRVRVATATGAATAADSPPSPPAEPGSAKRAETSPVCATLPQPPPEAATAVKALPLLSPSERCGGSALPLGPCCSPAPSLLHRRWARWSGVG